MKERDFFQTRPEPISNQRGTSMRLEPLEQNMQLNQQVVLQNWGLRVAVNGRLVIPRIQNKNYTLQLQSGWWSKWFYKVHPSLCITFLFIHIVSFNLTELSSNKLVPSIFRSLPCLFLWPSGCIMIPWRWPAYGKSGEVSVFGRWPQKSALSMELVTSFSGVVQS